MRKRKDKPKSSVSTAILVIRNDSRASATEILDTVIKFLSAQDNKKVRKDNRKRLVCTSKMRQGRQ